MAPTQLALLDNTVLSNFSIVRRPELVHLILDQGACTAEAALAECHKGMELGRIPRCDWSWLTVVPLGDADHELFDRLTRRLNAGEAACLAIAAHHGGMIFTDDRDARDVAMELHIPVSGTLGLLLLLVDRQHLALEEANGLLRHMITAGYHSPVADLATLI